MAAQVIVFNVCFTFYYVSYGLSLAVTTLVGNAVGSGNIKLAKKIAGIVMLIALALNLTIAVLCYALKT